MLRGKTVIEHDKPEFNRKWLKESIMSSLPQIALGNNKDNVSILYSPEACKDDIVISAMQDHKENEVSIDDLYKSAGYVRKNIERFKKDDSRPKEISNKIKKLYW